jgi:hypothetical protein
MSIFSAYMTSEDIDCISVIIYNIGILKLFHKTKYDTNLEEFYYAGIH